MTDPNNFDQLRDFVWHASGDISTHLMTDLDVVWHDLDAKVAGDLADSVIINAVADLMATVLAKAIAHLKDKPFSEEASKPLRDQIKKMCGDVVTKIMLEHKAPDGAGFGIMRIERGPEH